MIEVKVDEFRVTIPYDYETLGSDSYYINQHINAIDNALDLSYLFGEKRIYPKGMNGYTHVFKWGFTDKDSIYLMYNPDNMKMKFSLLFGGRALTIYLRQYRMLKNMDTNVFNMLVSLDKFCSIISDKEKQYIRLSRLDIAIDMIDEGIIVQDLYEDIINSRLFVFNKRNASINISRNMGSGTTTETIYFNKRKSNSFLRIYNKKIEQISRTGLYYYDAVNCNDWTRFECELKGDYAHSFTLKSLSCNNLDDFNELLVSSFIDCFKFKELEEIVGDKEILKDAYFYEQIKNLTSNESKVLFGHSRQELTDLEEKYLNFENNGTFAFFKMFLEAYGEEELNNLFSKIKNDINNFDLKQNHMEIIKQAQSITPFTR